MRKLSLTFFCMISALSAFAQRDVAQERMEQIFEEAKHPINMDWWLPRRIITIK